MDHEPNRQVTDDERDFWRAFTEAYQQSDFDYISATEVASDRTGLHESRARQIIRTWDNEGLVAAGPNDNKAALTEYGSHVEDIRSSMDSGEAW